ncbi:MAG: DUF1549 domain-containing protein, partial [Verrucomicrobia bacterium]|nr:DUF1549 domain-containing protein [Verrucomicrobiota bacterium]
ETWLRRVSFALSGLPPSTDLQHAFLTQDSPKTKAWVVDTLLASPHFGERWARHWMDLMRYAESRGHESDYIIPNAHHYRDYLIRAFNTDLPYDAFVREHLAGDLLSPPRTQPGNGANESILATGWVFLGEEVHSPVDIRQDECDRIDNKVDVFSKSFLGLTVACARCHDHKFDAIRAKDYYALSGFFLSSSYQQVRFESMENNQSIVNELESLRKKHQATIRASWKQWSKSGPERATKNLQSAILQLRQTQEGTREKSKNDWIEYILRAVNDENDSFQSWAQVLTGFQHSKITPNSIKNVSNAAQDTTHNTDVILDFTDQADTGTHVWRTSGPGFGTHPVRPGDFIWEEEKNRASIALKGAARRDRFWKDLTTSEENQNDPGSLAATSRAGQMIRTRTFTLKSGRLHYLIRGATRVYAAVDSHILITGPLHGSLVKTFDTKDSTTPRWVTHSLDDYQGHRVHLEFGPVDDRAIEILKVVDSITQPATPIQATWPNPENLDGMDSSKSWAPIFKEILRNTAQAISTGDVSKLPHGPIIAQWMMNHGDLLGIQNALKTTYTAYKKESNDLRNRVQWKSRTAVAWLDGNGVDEQILLRGKPHNKGDLAPRALPEAWPTSRPLSDPNSSGRLELAKQLTHPNHPLIARVMVNRVWHHLFGHGIVSSVDNFGYLGDRPSHPEMLDQLTWQFVHEQGWSLKQLIRGLVLSRTFGMASAPSSPRAMDVDPTNRLWHHYPVRRLESEAIRDALLTVSGRLVPDLYGRSVPVHLTAFVVGRGRPSVSGPLDGEGRRSIYTAVRRNFLPTFMQAFDFPTPFSTMG